ncbi:MAG: indole-3-glycerol phosphate synthase TrpC [Mariprofundaceae bacterium]|nr:indole-3-glycerol phosphate synthase TrpC [Mariprofundaceae bacterium]
MPSILDTIARSKKTWVKQCKQRQSEAALMRQVGAHNPCGFALALHQRSRNKQNAVIAEIKKASPSKGIIRADFDPVWIASRYVEHGACCLSVLTDMAFFQGHDDHFRAIRNAVIIPMIRKDFMLDPYQVIESAAMGADAVLLIMAMLDDYLLQELAAVAEEFKLDILPEVHNREELDRVLEYLPASKLIGINNRNLHTFTVDLQTTVDLLPHCPAEASVTAESGIHHADDIARMNKAGVHAFLVGESLMRQPDPGKALHDLLL